MPTPRKNQSSIVSALRARTNFGALLRTVETEGASLVIVNRGRPCAVVLSLRDYVRLACPEPEVLKIIGQESEAEGMDRITSRQIDAAISGSRKKITRAKCTKRK
jgi:prevent-host-death family protein